MTPISDAYKPTARSKRAINAPTVRASTRGTVMVSNGYTTREAFHDIYDHIDAANIDLKAFTENFYDNMVIGVNKMYLVGTIFSSPVVVDNAIYFGSTDGNLYALH